MRLKVAIFSVFAIVSVPITSFGEVLVDYPPWSAGVGLYSILPGAQQVADDFIVPAGFRLTEIAWGGNYNKASIAPGITAVDFTLRFFTGETLPNSLIHTVSQSASFEYIGESLLFVPSYRFTAPIDMQFDFATDTRIWLSILESDPTTAAEFRWTFRSEAYSSPAAFRLGEEANWTNTGNAMSLKVSGDYVPEPSTFALLIVGCAAIGSRRRAPR